MSGETLPSMLEHLPRLVRELEVRTVYTDLDGTLLGPGGSLIGHPSGPTAEPAAALAALAEAGLDLILVSGRTRHQLRDVARLTGAMAAIAELGGLTVYRDGRTEIVVRERGTFAGRGTPYQAIARTGACGLLLDAYAGRLEPHEPWSSLPRETSMLLRGNVDAVAARDLLQGSGFGWLDVLDNGVISPSAERFPTLRLEPGEDVRAYHLLPVGVTKRSAVAADRARRAVPRERCLAVGDSASDVDMASEVGAVLLVSNAAAAVRGLPLPPNVFITPRSHGLGFADAVMPFVDASLVAGPQADPGRG